MIEGSMRMVKFLLGFFNLVVFCFSLSLLGLGINLKENIISMEGLNINTARAPTTAFIIIGSILFLISFLGCYGSFAENQCMLITYGVTISVLFFLQSLLAGLIFSYKEDLEDAVLSQLHQDITNYNRTYEKCNDLLCTLQKSAMCCGINGPSDWKANSSTDKYLPPSCCYDEKLEDLEMTNHCTEGLWHSTDGCKEKVYQFIKKNSIVILGILVFLCFLQVISIVFAYCLSCSIRPNYDSI